MIHLKTITALLLLWILIYLFACFLSWDINLMQKFINQIPERESYRFLCLVFLFINCVLYRTAKDAIEN